ncbi:hypothetical protein MTO96_010255 [Rhipicephalus appendiculatus]
MRCTVATAVLLCILANLSDCLSGDKVKLADVQVLTFQQGLYTTGRRSRSVPQLNCRGGSAGCQDQPSVVQCYNRGTNGQDVQWDCDAEMTRSQKFGLIQVKCEGYDYPQDEYILVGSCGLEYRLEKTGYNGGSSLSAGGDGKMTVTSHQRQGNTSSDTASRSPMTPSSSIQSIDIQKANCDGVIVEEIKETFRYQRAVLTFRQGLYTTARRSPSVPQLNCRGGSAGCQDQPSVVKCYNRGTNGRDVQWECKAEMNDTQKFGTIQVKCEGYDSPQDEYVLEGSCSVFFMFNMKNWPAAQPSTKRVGIEEA